MEQHPQGMVTAPRPPEFRKILENVLMVELLELSVQGHEVDSMIPMDPFQIQIFWFS